MASILSTLTSSSWLCVWEWVEAISIVVIGIGCWGEGWSEHHRFRDDLERKLTGSKIQTRWKGFFWKMVVGGLAIELFAFGLAFLASNREIEGLHKTNLELQAKLQPRIITQKQINDFMFLTENLPKFPLRVLVGQPMGLESVSYAWQIRKMLVKAKFPVPDCDTNSFLQIAYMQSLISVFELEENFNEHELVDIQLISNCTNDPTIFRYYSIEKTNGFTRFGIPANETNDLYGALINYFTQIGIKANWDPMKATNCCAILIQQKLH